MTDIARLLANSTLGGIHNDNETCSKTHTQEIKRNQKKEETVRIKKFRLLINFSKVLLELQNVKWHELYVDNIRKHYNSIPN